MACASDNVSKKDQETLEEHLKCPICFEVFRTPRALACMHTFCQDCISEHIVKSGLGFGSIECPTCRQPTRVSDSRKPRAEWCKLLPLNYTLLPLLEALEKESKESESDPPPSSTCSSCKIILNVTVSYCVDCTGIVCMNCAQLHQQLKVFESHNIYDFAKSAAPRKCEKHEAKLLEFFCEFHKMAVCSNCAVADHRGCHSVIELKDDVVKDTIKLKSGEMSERLSMAQTTVKLILEKFANCSGKFCENTEKVADHYGTYKDSVDEKAKAHTACVMQCTSLLEKVEKLSSLLSACQVTKTKECMFIVLQNISSDIDRFEKEMHDLKAVDTNTWNASSVIGNFVEKVAPLGNATMNSRQRSDTSGLEGAVGGCKPTMEVGANIRLEGDGDISNSASSNNLMNESFEIAKDIRLRCVRSSSLQKGSKGMAPWFNGLVHLRDGCLVAIDNQNEELVLMNEVCQPQEILQLEEQPIGIAAENENFVAVVFMFSQVMMLYYVADFGCDSRSLYPFESVNLDIFPRAVACTSLGFTVADKHTIMTVDKTGQKLKENVCDITDLNVRTCDIKHIIVNESVNMMYISDQDTNTLTVLSYGVNESKPFYRVKKMKTPAGLDYDVQNNIYVCCERENSIMVLSAHGDDITQINVHSCRYPSSIAFNKARKKFWITNRESPEVMKEFDITHYLF